MIRFGKLPLAIVLCLGAAALAQATGDQMKIAPTTPLRPGAGKIGAIDHLELTATDVRSVYRLLSEYAGVDIIVDPTVTGQVNATINNKNWQEVVQIVAKMLNLTVTNELGYLYVQKTEDFNKKLLDKAVSSQSQATMVKLQRKIIRVNNATAEDMDKAVKELLSPRGKTTVVSRTNSIIVTDGEEQIAAIEKVIKQLDLETNQVMIEAKLIQVSSGTTQELGVKWNLQGRLPGASGQKGAGGNLAPGSVGIANNTPANGNVQQSITFGLLNGDLNATLQHLLSTNKGEVVASPQITTLDNKLARIFMGDKVPVNTRDVSGNTVTTYVDAGTELIVTPLITSSDRILLSLKPSRNSYEVVSGAGTVIRTQNAETNVFVSDGETVVIGGLVSKEEKKTESGIPLLKDIPFIGFLFKNSRKELSKTDLIIFVTPHIVRRGVSTKTAPPLVTPATIQDTPVDKTNVSVPAPVAPAAVAAPVPAPQASAPVVVPAAVAPVPEPVRAPEPQPIPVAAPASEPAAPVTVVENPVTMTNSSYGEIPPPSMDTVSSH
ncbi:MAG: hypothetical protein RL318_2310 [Fibrobacterota bacterium]|jgi:type IV pilus secretin PilQ/predicted competence protein